ncbi:MULTISPECIES: lysophospholipid acyltransferase family protein [Caulobacter]|jgi:1-acyl-sn-glycerol-3-phosphate acyltransferase|uniref:1-acyl-sn-glycerol-3-phosphate acyltransferase n=1 Tax=Caulobacter vibrioides OR37 TaxID=1292034 RepID=R0EE58_CAUVI|nr:MULTISPECIES: lysophospholipid acyltransferase family protein [Caulobacter]ENZ83678.1 1-acyl-sn-glycerol-3-phosphate acyltransferase [Caulobacter vibrioides OR37]MBQ1560526.1 lysophospholipid acyltransferase family protein [Caulobacter sp.]
MNWLARVVKWALSAHFKLRGWRIEGEPPTTRKFVIVAAPHTSNWDFVYFVGAADALGLDLSFIGKASLFKPPFDTMMRDLGGIPLDRERSKDMVKAMIEEFARRDQFMLTIAPEGTRGKARQWKTGFYHIAVGAGVPIVLGMMDYRRKRVGLGPALYPTGDYEADMRRIAGFYETCTPKFPELATRFEELTDSAAAPPPNAP